MSLLDRHSAVLPDWMGLYYEDPLELVSGSGSRVTDAAGRTYLDFFGGILTTMTGYHVHEVVEAVAGPGRPHAAHVHALPHPSP